MNVLLVAPKFPKSKSKNFNKSLPVGLLKIGAWLKDHGHRVQLVQGCRELDFTPDEIYVTSLFTYWHKYSSDCIAYYKTRYPQAKVLIGGIYASLMPEHAAQSGADEVHIGTHPEAEKYEPDYSLLPETLDYQIVHASRGCIRRCNFCMVWKIEPKYEWKPVDQVICEIKKNKVLFFDNQLLAHNQINELLEALAEVRIDGKVVRYEAQSGFDARLLTQELADLIKAARFTLPRIAWDGSVESGKTVKAAIEMLVRAGYSRKNIQVFMIYNHDVPLADMEKKRQKCRRWGVQIADCRYRPEDQLFDNYDGRKVQTAADYHIHPNWTDEQVKTFRKYCRWQNILVRINLKDFDPTRMNYNVPTKVLNEFGLTIKKTIEVI